MIILLSARAIVLAFQNFAEDMGYFKSHKKRGRKSMNSYEKLIAQLELGSTIERRNAFDSLQMLANPWIVQHSLLNFVLTAKEQHLEWLLEGYDYEQGEGHKSGFTLLNATIDEAWWCVAAATALFIEFGASSIDTLLPRLEDEKAIVRAWTAFVLGKIGDKLIESNRSK
jgi:hypothetical protein